MPKRKRSKYPPGQTVIFDFDGTIADTFLTSVRIFERLTKRREPFTDSDVRRLRGLHALELIRELRIKPWRVPWLLARGRAAMRKEMGGIIVFDGIEQVLQQLRAANVTVYIMSSNSPGNIRKLLVRLGLDHYFEQIYGNVGIFGKAKMLRLIIARNRLDPARTYYVGDEGRDVEAAKRVGLCNVAVTWGYNSRPLLLSHHPQAIVDRPQELIDVLLAGNRDDTVV